MTFTDIPETPSPDGSRNAHGSHRLPHRDRRTRHGTLFPGLPRLLGHGNRRLTPQTARLTLASKRRRAALRPLALALSCLVALLLVAAVLQPPERAEIAIARRPLAAGTRISGSDVGAALLSGDLAPAHASGKEPEDPSRPAGPSGSSAGTSASNVTGERSGTSDTGTGNTSSDLSSRFATRKSAIGTWTKTDIPRGSPIPLWAISSRRPLPAGRTVISVPVSACPRTLTAGQPIALETEDGRGFSLGSGTDTGSGGEADASEGDGPRPRLPALLWSSPVSGPDASAGTSSDSGTTIEIAVSAADARLVLSTARRCPLMVIAV